MFERKSCWESYIWCFWNVWEFRVHLFSMSLRGGTRSDRRRLEEPGILDFLFNSKRKQKWGRKQYIYIYIYIYIATVSPTIYDSQPPAVDVLHSRQSFLLPLRILRSKRNMNPPTKIESSNSKTAPKNWVYRNRASETENVFWSVTPGTASSCPYSFNGRHDKIETSLGWFTDVVDFEDWKEVQNMKSVSLCEFNTDAEYVMKVM